MLQIMTRRVFWCLRLGAETDELAGLSEPEVSKKNVMTSRCWCEIED
jgi:hypothetical protein